MKGNTPLPDFVDGPLPEPFDLDKYPSKTQLIPASTDTVTALVLNADASHFIRKAILDRCHKFWLKDLREVPHSAILGLCNEKQTKLEAILNTFLAEKLGWCRGQCHEDAQVSILYKTFLKENDYRVDEATLEKLMAAQ